MSEKSDLFARIGQCEQEIARIRADIESMKAYKSEVIADIDKCTIKMDYSNGYDMTVDNTWRKQLCDQAIDLQVVVNQELQNSIDDYEGLVNDFVACINNALRMIGELEAEITRCRARIAQIEEEERRAAEDRRKHPERYRC
ncbi:MULTISPECIES: hypothetical protein [Pseudobutyrivibrio]|jgi:prefoldin subunit 5|uniref:DUF5082 domain-containing protein n=1 Tax=Pseudobutyrivibrio ruminis TaxID=46206 RepID=A0A2G3DXV4_9FIRM|nr:MULTISPECIES: hypothetical protein [Pseudobutyrivibrio]PHU35695.1 hypothetical protein CSX01_03585 [Pseudobutyrivibrio ruminis]